MPVNTSGDRSGSSSSSGPFGFLNAPSKAARKAKVSKPAPAKPTPTVRKAAPKATAAVTIGPAGFPQVSPKRSGTAGQRKAIRKSYDRQSASEKRDTLAHLTPGSVKADTILSTHADRVQAQRSARHAIADVVEALTTKPKDGGGLNLGSLVTAGVDAAIAPAAVVAAKVLPGKASDAAKLTAKVGHNAATDAVDLPLNTPASLYHLGDTARHDPIKAAKLLADPYIETAKHPGRSLVDHPLNTGLLFAGTEGAVGRTAGAVARTGALGERAAQAASTAREAARVPGTELRQDRSYSPDVIRKGVQVAAEKQRAKVAVRKPTVMSDAQINRRVDEHVAAREDIRRAHRTAAVNAAHDATHDTTSRRIRRPKATTKPTAGTTLAVQGVARTQPELQAYLARLESEAPNLKGARLKANRSARSEVRKAIKAGDPRKAADRYTQEVSLPLQRKLTDRGVVNVDQAERARLIPYAVTKMGARHLTADEIKRTLTEARATHKTATADLAASVEEVAAARRALARAQGRAAILSRNVGGTAAERAAERKRTPTYEAGGHGVSEAHAALTDAEQRAAHAKAAVEAAQEGVRRAQAVKSVGGTLVAHDGSELTNEAIRAHMHEHGVPEPGYVTNAPNQRGARNFYVAKSGHEPVKVGPAKRTGKAITEGTADLHPDVLVEGAARAQGLVDAADSYNAFLKEFGVRGRSGKLAAYPNYKAAREAADAHVIDEHGDPIPGAVPMRPVQLTPFAGRSEQLSASLEHINRDADTPATQEAVQHALTGDEKSRGPWTLVPDTAARRHLEHLRVTGTGVPGKTANLIGSRFRQTVLATNPKWLVGNSVEAALRSLVAGAGPGSYIVGKGALQRLKASDPEAYLEARSRMVGGGHMKMNSRVQTFTHAEQFAGTKLAGVATALGKFWRTPGPKQLAAVWHGYTDFVFNTLNGRIESQFQTAMLGKALKRSPLMSEHTVKLSKAAMDEAARGLHDTNAQAALGREVDRMYGAYSKFSPTERHLIAGYTPFIAWALNATNFLARVLPADHPVLTSVLASANLATEQWRKDHGLKFGDGGAPFYLQGAVPVDGGLLRVAKYTPFGVAQSPSGAGGTLAGSLLPQFASVLENLKGNDWKGNKLKPGQSPVLTAAVSLIEGTVPVVGQADRIAHNPGNLGAKLRKELDPTYAVKPGRPRVRKAGGTSPSPGGLPSLPSLPTLPALPKLPELPTLKAP